MSLVELLVVIAIIGILASLLLPAVTAQRETARKTQCVSRFRQVGVGLHAYHDAYSKLPSGHVVERENGPDGKSWGWGALLLPFLEEHALSDQLEPTKRSFDAAASDLARARYLQTSVGLYRCPSDTGGELSHFFRWVFVPFAVRSQLAWSPNRGVASPPPAIALAGIGLPLAHVFPPPDPPPGEPPLTGGIPARLGRSNHVACLGSQWKSERWTWGDPDFEGNGLFGRNSEVRHSEISDGASKTIAVGERSERNYAAVWAGGNSWLGCGFTDNQMVLGTAFYPINDAPISQNIDCDGQGAANFSSYHRGGANFLFADGSVHFLDEQIDVRVFRALANRSDGENVGDF